MIGTVTGVTIAIRAITGTTITTVRATTRRATIHSIAATDIRGIATTGPTGEAVGYGCASEHSAVLQ